MYSTEKFGGGLFDGRFGRVVGLEEAAWGFGEFECVWRI